MGGGSARCISAPDVCLKQLAKERVYSNHLNPWKIYVFQCIEVLVFCDDETCIGCNGTIYKLVIVGISSNKTKFKIGRKTACIVATNKDIQHVVGNIFTQKQLIISAYSAMISLETHRM